MSVEGHSRMSPESTAVPIHCSFHSNIGELIGSATIHSSSLRQASRSPELADICLATYALVFVRLEFSLQAVWMRVEAGDRKTR